MGLRRNSAVRAWDEARRPSLACVILDHRARLDDCRARSAKADGLVIRGLTLGSLIWIVPGYLASDYALLAQNVAITLINCLGIYRWLIWQGKV